MRGPMPTWRRWSRRVSGGGIIGQQVALVGPLGYGLSQFLPAGTPLPYTVQFASSATATTAVGEVQIETQLDPNLDPRSFRLGDLQVGDIHVHIPSGRA